MDRLSARTTTMASLLTLAMSLSASDTVAQQKPLKEQLVGSWTFASSTGKRADGSSMWGENAKGLLIFAADGRFFQGIMRADRPKFASNSRLQGTPDENKAVVQGTIAFFGTYTVNEADKTLTYQIEGATYPNWDATTQKRPFTITGDEFKYTNPAPSSGGTPTEVAWKRAR